MVCGNCKKEDHNRTKCKAPCGRCGSNDHINEIMVAGEKKVCRHDAYSPDILRRRFKIQKQRTIEDNEFLQETGIPFRKPNLPEDITENILKYVVINHENDLTCVWCRLIGLPGDLNSLKQGVLESKSFTSPGPSSFGAKKKFNAIYFIDMREWLNDLIIIWKVSLTHDSDEWKGIKMNEEETNEQQCEKNIRAHISWENIKSQLPKEKVSEIYNGTFEGIFTAKPSTSPQSV